MNIPSYGAELHQLDRVETTFWQDFTIADAFGIDAIKDTFKRAFAEWKDDIRYVTELSLVLNHKLWQHYEMAQGDESSIHYKMSVLYDEYWRKVNDHAYSNAFDDEAKKFYFTVTD